MSAVGGPLYRVATHSATACLGLPPVRPPHGRRLLAAACPGQTAPHCSGQCGRAELSFRFYTRQCNAPRAFFGLNTVTGRRAISSVVAWQGTVLRSWPIHSFISARGAASCGVCTVPQNTIRLSAAPPPPPRARTGGGSGVVEARHVGGGTARRGRGARAARCGLRAPHTRHAQPSQPQHHCNTDVTTKGRGAVGLFLINYFCQKKRVTPYATYPFLVTHTS